MIPKPTLLEKLKWLFNLIHTWSENHTRATLFINGMLVGYLGPKILKWFF